MANPQTENGYTNIANELMEAFMKLKINGTQWRILLVILRKTYGWRKKEDKISLSQFEECTILPRRLLSRELLGLEKRKIILVQSAKGKTKSYALQKDYERWVNYLPISRQLNKRHNSQSINQSVDRLSTNQSRTIYQTVDELSIMRGNTKEIKENTKEIRQKKRDEPLELSYNEKIKKGLEKMYGPRPEGS